MGRVDITRPRVVAFPIRLAGVGVPLGSVLVDRVAERAAVDSVVMGARRGSSAVLVLRGMAGIGKSALLDYSVSMAGDMEVSRITGVESEIALGYAGLHQLVLPFLDRMGELPEPQCHALESVFGLGEYPGPDALLVFLAVLTLLDVASRTRGLLLVVDDAQWLDEESARVLAFVARRLHAEPIAMLFAIREGPGVASDPLAGLPEVHVTGLPATDARAMLEHLVGEPIDRKVADQIVAQTDGNPLALGEIVAELTDEQRRGESPLPEPLPVGAMLQGLFADRARSLPAGGRTLVLLASAERLGDLALLNRAAVDMGVAWEDAVASIEEAGFATFAPAVRFRHPLVRSAVYHSSTPRERRLVHGALAAGLDPVHEADRRAWHLASAASAPDEGVALALELAGERAFQRGGTHAAAEYLLRASELTPDPVRRTERLLGAVRMRAAEGDVTRAQALLDTVRHQLPPSRHRAAADWTQGLISLGEGRGRESLATLAHAVGMIERYDEGFSLDVLISAENAALYVGSLDDDSLVDAVATGARRLLPAGRLTPTELLVKGVAMALTDGYLAAAATLRAALAGLLDPGDVSAAIPLERSHERVNPLHLLAVNAAVALLDDGALASITRSWVAFARRTRTLSSLPIALDVHSVSEVLAGRFRSAEAAIAEADDILSIVGSRGHIGDQGVGKLFLDAYRGNEEDAQVFAARRSQDATERGSGVDLDQSDYAMAVLDLGAGRHASALERCNRIFARDLLTFSVLSLPVSIEAAVRCGDTVTARASLERFTQRTAASGSEWSQGLLDCMQAMVTNGGEAEKHYRAAIERLSHGTAAFDGARAELLYGEWLRRNRRRRDARVPLRAALEFFERSGANALVERARRELVATGESVAARTDATPQVLTAQETQIARLVVDGGTNAEIAVKLYLSTSTVEYHLRKMYRKLGVTTRTQLARHVTTNGGVTTLSSPR